MMLEELQRRHYSEATTRRYIRFIERFAQHFHRSPDRLGPQHIREYQAQLFTLHKLTPGSVTNHLHHNRLRSVALTESWGTLGDNFEVEANSDTLRVRFAEGHILTEFRGPIGNAFFQKTRRTQNQTNLQNSLSRPCTCGNP